MIQPSKIFSSDKWLLNWIMSQTEGNPCSWALQFDWISFAGYELKKSVRVGDEWVAFKNHTKTKSGLEI